MLQKTTTTTTKIITTKKPHTHTKQKNRLFTLHQAGYRREMLQWKIKAGISKQYRFDRGEAAARRLARGAIELRSNEGLDKSNK